jgi:hypothetical protein
MLTVGDSSTFGVVYGYGGKVRPLEEEEPSMPVHFKQ